MTEAAGFSVVIPLYNREHLIAATLDAVLAQTVRPAEVIVVDDASTDAGAAVVERYAPAVTLVRNGKQGVQAARNAGIARAKTDWIALCDSDDLWEPTWIERLGALQREAPGLDFIFGNFRVFREGTRSERSKFDDAPSGFWERAGRRVLAQGWTLDGALAGETFLWHPIFPSAMAFKTSLLARAGGFDVGLAGRRNEDGEFTLRLLYHARVGAIPDPLVSIRKHESNVSGDQLRLLLDEVALLRFIRDTHEEARPYGAVIEREIVRRSVQAVDLAFAAREHAITRDVFATLPRPSRSPKLRAKRLVAGLPDPIALPLNALLQRLGSPVSDG